MKEKNMLMTLFFLSFAHASRSVIRDALVSYSF